MTNKERIAEKFPYHFSRFSPPFNFLKLLASAFALTLFLERVVRQPTSEIAALVRVRVSSIVHIALHGRLIYLCTSQSNKGQKPTLNLF